MARTGRPPFRPTDRRVVEELTVHGVGQAVIARLLGVAAMTPRRAFREAFDIGNLRANAAVARVLLLAATDAVAEEDVVDERGQVVGRRITELRPAGVTAAVFWKGQDELARGSRAGRRGGGRAAGAGAPRPRPPRAVGGQAGSAGAASRRPRGATRPARPVVVSDAAPQASSIPASRRAARPFVVSTKRSAAIAAATSRRWRAR
jgi:hypothetical protein